MSQIFLTRTPKIPWFLGRTLHTPTENGNFLRLYKNYQNSSSSQFSFGGGTVLVGSNRR